MVPVGDDSNNDLMDLPWVNIETFVSSVGFEPPFLFPPLDTKDFVDAGFPLCCDVRSRARARLVFTGMDGQVLPPVP